MTAPDSKQAALENLRGREILFYSDFPMGFHNPEAEDRMRRFAQRGYRVSYVEGLGINNPRAEHLARQLKALRWSRDAQADAQDGLSVVSPKILPVRRASLISSWNERWLPRQLLGALEDPREAIFWIRFPSPELCRMLEVVRPHLLVYELVDEHRSPRLTRRVTGVFDEAERRILARSDLVFASSEKIASRLGRLHDRVVLSPAAAVDVQEMSAVARRTVPTERLALCVGGLDHRFDIELLLGAAAKLPGWRFVLAGQAKPHVRRGLSGVPNITLLGHRPPSELPELIASAAVCLVPYKVDDVTDALFPIKIVLYLAAGRPVVSPPIDATDRFDGMLEVAGSEDFVAAMQRAAMRDDDMARARRTAYAERFSWSRRITEMELEMASAVPGANRDLSRRPAKGTRR